MPVLGFRKEFVEAVRSGRKTQTIRRLRSRPIQEGQTLYLYSGLRTKHAKKIMEVPCISVQPIKLFVLSSPLERVVQIGEDWLSVAEKEDLAKADGFENFLQFFGFFFNYDPDKELEGFEGQLIKWRSPGCTDNNSGIEL